MTETEELTSWLPMYTAPHDGRYIAAKPHRDDCPMIVSWTDIGTGDGPGWWLEEGALFKDKDFIGWWPLPVD